MSISPTAAHPHHNYFQRASDIPFAFPPASLLTEYCQTPGSSDLLSMAGLNVYFILRL
jgi:hypothetical protein